MTYFLQPGYISRNMNEWTKATEEAKVHVGLQGKLRTGTAKCVSQRLVGFSDHLYTTHYIHSDEEGKKVCWEKQNWLSSVIWHLITSG